MQPSAFLRAGGKSHIVRDGVDPGALRGVAPVCGEGLPEGKKDILKQIFRVLLSSGVDRAKPPHRLPVRNREIPKPVMRFHSADSLAEQANFYSASRIRPVVVMEQYSPSRFARLMAWTSSAVRHTPRQSLRPKVKVASSTSQVSKPRLPAILTAASKELFVMTPATISTVWPARRWHCSRSVPMKALLGSRVDLGSAMLALNPIATKREAQGSANIAQAVVAQTGHSPSQSPLRNRHRIVQVHGAGTLHAIPFVQRDLRGHPSYRRCDWRNGNCRQITDRAVARQHHDRSLFIGRSELIEPNISPGYSLGHAASDSQAADSSCAAGRTVYPALSLSSRDLVVRRRRCSRRASRTRAERFCFVWTAARSVASKSFLSRTT